MEEEVRKNICRVEPIVLVLIMKKLWDKNKIIGGERYLKDWVPEASKIKGPNGMLLYATEPRFVPKMNDDWNKLTKTMEKTNYSGYFGSYKPASNEKII